MMFITSIGFNRKRRIDARLLGGLLLVLMVMLLAGLSGCNTTPSSTSKPAPLTGELAALNWLQQADSSQDAQAAIANKDYRLLAINLRGLVLPGVAKDMLEKVKQRCHHRFLDGMGDVIRSKAHRQWWQKGRAYAQAYNEIMVGHCLKHSGGA